MTHWDSFDDDEVRYFSFNHIYVIETLYEDEYGQNEQTGKALYRDLLRWSAERHQWLEASYKFVHNSTELFDALTRIKADATTGKIFPLVHIEGHGNQTGLETGKDETREILRWETLTAVFREINVATKNNLLLTIATCYGSNIYKGIRISERAPFFGFIAPLAKVSFGEIAEGFNTFFDSIINTSRFDDAVMALRGPFNGSPPRLTYLHCETLFRKVADNILEEWRNPIENQKMLLGLISRNMSNVHVRLKWTIPQIVDNSAYALSQREEWLKTWHDNFLMKDLH